MCSQVGCLHLQAASKLASITLIISNIEKHNFMLQKHCLQATHDFHRLTLQVSLLLTSALLLQPRHWRPT